MLQLSTAQTDADFNDVYGFWYDVYVAEMGRHLNDANTSHQHRKLYDPLAKAGSLCVARRDGEVVGTVLSTAVDHPATEKYRGLYGLETLEPSALWSSAITTKFMVRADLRRSRLPMRLAFATFDWGLRAGIKHNYIDCNDHLLGLFAKLGYRTHLPALYHKDYGRVNSLRLNITDGAHLQDVDSPFLPLLQRFLIEQKAAAPAHPPAAAAATTTARIYRPQLDIAQTATATKAETNTATN